MNEREQWLENRRKGIGGSDAAAVLGLSKWKTPLQVYQEKRGEIGGQEDNEAMLWGRVLEPAVRQQYAERTGRVVRIPEGILTHPDHPFMLANVDGVTDDGRLVEIKTARTPIGFGEPGTDEVPQAYLIQVQHYLTVTELSIADLAVLIGGSDYRQYEIPADAELQGMIIEGEAAFWKHVEDGIPPEPISFADMQQRYGRSSTSAKVIAGREIVEAVELLRKIKEANKAGELAEEEQKAIIMKALGEADTLIDDSGNILCTWKAAKPAQRFDAKAFQVVHPDLYAQFLKVGEVSRRFLLK
jgi:putative phage-type endonuclease